MASHNHDHDHDHEHGSELSDTQLRVRALETVLTEKGYIDPAALDAIIEAYETKIGPRNGAVVVAKAWTDPAFKKALLEDATKAVASMLTDDTARAYAGEDYEKVLVRAMLSISNLMSGGGDAGHPAGSLPVAAHGGRAVAVEADVERT